jgi:hypothetical protein
MREKSAPVLGEKDKSRELEITPAVAEAAEAGESREYRSVPGIERVGNGEKSQINFGLGYDWKVQLNNDHISTSLSNSSIAAANLLDGLNVSPDDGRKLRNVLLPTVVQEDGEWVLKRVNAKGEVEDLYRGDRKAGYRLSEITTPRKTQWGSYPVYTKEALALYLEAVLHSDMSQEEKDRFVDALLQTNDFDENIVYSRPLYEGGDTIMHEKGKRITLPTGQSLRISGDNRLRLDSPRQGYSSNSSDVAFVMALVERGRLPLGALDSIYTLDIRGDVVRLGNAYMLNQSVSIDLSKPFDKKIDFLPIYLSYLLTRDPRINAEDRKRLRQHFGNNIDLKVIPSDY